MSYQYHNNILSIPARLLYADWELITYTQYEKWSKPSIKKLIKTKEGKGMGNEAFVSYYDMPDFLRIECKERLGDPQVKGTVAVNRLEPHIMPDAATTEFFANHRTPDGKQLSLPKRVERANACFILNAITALLQGKGRGKTKIWQEISDAVNTLSEKWPHCLPAHPRRLQDRYAAYKKEGRACFIHKGEGNENTIKIKGEVGDWLLAMYCLPSRLTVPQLMAAYAEERAERADWPVLTREAVYGWLHKPENVRIWTLSRNGKDVYNRKFKHTLSRDKDSWFPNVYWSIDGSKVDWKYVDAAGKVQADLRADLVFDLYSEKIIGWSFSRSENHTDHFAAIKMAVQTAGCRPYLLTYDRQSGHMMERMQELYGNLIAKDGGAHYPHRAYSHASPAEQIFNRFQQQQQNKMWFNDGQSITVKTDQNKPNLDFIKDNRHLLYDYEQAHAAWVAVVNRWNAAAHPRLGCSRNEAYTHAMPMQEPLGLTDILQYLWLNDTKNITYRREGLTISVADKDYTYEVYTPDGGIDLEFRRVSIGKKFVVRYEPDHLDAYVQLFEKKQDGSLLFVAHAEPKRKHIDVPALMQPGDKERFNADYKVWDLELERDFNALQTLFKRTGISPEKLIADQDALIKNKGFNSKQDNIIADSLEYDLCNRM
jgi:hypothetical protein